MAFVDWIIPIYDVLLDAANAAANYVRTGSPTNYYD